MFYTGQSSFSFAERVAKVDFEAVLAHAIKVTGYFGLTTRPTSIVKLLVLSTVHTTRVHGPCTWAVSTAGRPVNTGIQNETHGPWWIHW